MVLERAGRKIWRLLQRFIGPLLKARWLPLVIVAAFALVLGLPLSSTFPPIECCCEFPHFLTWSPSMHELADELQISSHFSIPAALDSSSAAHNGRQLPQACYTPSFECYSSFQL
jgi:hypothetical protein